MNNPKVELAQLLAEREKRDRQRLFYRTFPDEGPLRRELYAKHMEFIGLTKTYTECALISGNQVGKCASVTSYVALPGGARKNFGELYKAGKPFMVNAWDDMYDIVVLATALPPIKKLPEPCVRLWFTDGSWFECAHNHRVLLSSGDYSFVSELIPEYSQAYLQTPLESNSEYAPSIHASDAPRLSEIPQGFLAGCLASLRFCDARLHSVEAACLSYFRRSAYVLKYSSALSGQDVYSSTGTSSRLQVSDRLSNRDEVGRFLAQTAVSLVQGLYNGARWLICGLQNVQRLLLESFVRPRLNGEALPDQSLFDAYHAPNGGNQIIAYEPIPAQEVYDFTVPQFENYIANKVVHHNTLTAGFFVTAAATGDYPHWWHGKRWDGPINCWAAGDTNETVRNIIQETLLGPPDAFGTGMIPAKYLPLDKIKRRAGSVADAVESFEVKHVNGGKNSRIALKAYEQKRKSFQGTKKDLIWLDEEPPEDVYSECFTRTANTDGIIICTFTPLNGISDIVLAFMEDEYGDHRE